MSHKSTEVDGLAELLVFDNLLIKNSKRKTAFLVQFV